MSALSWLPSIPYPQPTWGYWLPHTSTIDWCEVNYYATPYAAEIVNTLTNALFVYLAIRGLRDCVKYNHDTVFIVTFIGYMLVGLGSLAFHATLQYEMQLVDELSMVYTTALSNYASFSYKRSRLYSFLVATFLVGLMIFITGYYHYIKDPKFHQNAYAILTATVLLRSMYIMEVSLRPSLRAREQKHLHQQEKKIVSPAEAAEQTRQDRRDEQILKTMWIMITYGIGIFLGGFAIWGIDNVYCGQLRTWREEIGLPWGILLEGHGWWHLMTGTGAYFYIQWGIWLRHCLDGKQDEYELVWPRLVTSLPTVVRRKALPATGSSNGLSRKDI